LLVGAHAAFPLHCPDSTTFPLTVAAGTAANTFSILGFPDNTPITLKKDCQYNFTVSSEFHIKTFPGGTGSTSDDLSIVLNGASSGTISWIPSTVGVWQYSNGVDAAIFGNITVVPNTASCAQYCSDFRLACGSMTSVYASEAQCEAACLIFPDVPSYTFASGVPSYSRQCRMEQADCAARSCGVDPGIGTLCDNAGFVGLDAFADDGLCQLTSGSYCDSYCDAAASACTGNLRLYPDRATCMGECALFDYTDLTPAANNFACRKNGVLTALLDPASGCPMASSSGGNTCGTFCNVFCGAFGTCAALANCPATCAGYPTNGALLGSRSPSVQCYISTLYNYNAGLPGATCNYLSACPVPSSSVGVASSSAAVASSSVVAASSSGASGVDNSGATENQASVAIMAILLIACALF